MGGVEEAPEGRIPAGTAPPSVHCELNASKDGEASEERIPAGGAPPAGYCELDASKERKPPRGVSHRAQHPERVLLSGRK